MYNLNQRRLLTVKRSCKYKEKTNSDNYTALCVVELCCSREVGYYRETAALVAEGTVTHGVVYLADSS